MGNNLLSRLFHSVRHSGIRVTFIKVYSNLYDRYFDFKYGLDTHAWVSLDDLDIHDDSKKHAVLYQPTRVLPLRKLFSLLNLERNSTFVDIGCGKGRVIILASEYGFKEVIGVELSPSLCQIAEKNATSFKSNSNVQTKISVVNKDALSYQFNDNEKVFFLYNPFDNVILEKVIQNVKASLVRNQRTIWMIYANPIHTDLIKERMKIVSTRNLNIMEFEFVVYKLKL